MHKTERILIDDSMKEGRISKLTTKENMCERAARTSLYTCLGRLSVYLVRTLMQKPYQAARMVESGYKDRKNWATRSEDANSME
jgi:hypothetical protein